MFRSRKLSSRKLSKSFVFITALLALSMMLWEPANIQNVLAVTGNPQVSWGSTMGDNASITGSNFSCRFIIRPSIAGNTIRIHLSNLYGTAALTFTATTVAFRTSGAAVSGITTVTFGGQKSVTVAARGDVTSDAIAFALKSQQDIAVSVYIAGANPATSYNRDALSTQYCTSVGGTAGNHTTDTAGTAFTSTSQNMIWVHLIDIYNSPLTGAIVALGDSITAGTGSTIDGYNSWVDLLTTRVVTLPSPKSVINEGLGSDVVCSNKNNGGVDRLQRDVLGLADVSHVILALGTNDLAGSTTGSAVIACYQTIISQVHAAGLKIIGATIIPRSFNSTRESYRTQANTFIRTAGNFDGVIDFDAAVRDPSNPTRILPAYDWGDHVHPSPAGHQAMSNAINLALFGLSGGGTTTYDDESSAFVYTGSHWTHSACNSKDHCYNNTNSWESTTNEYATISFSGTQIKLYAVTDKNMGFGAASIDGGSETNVDFYSNPRNSDVLVWTSPTLVKGSHTLKIRITGTHDSSSTGNTISLDRADVLP